VFSAASQNAHSPVPVSLPLQASNTEPTGVPQGVKYTCLTTRGVACLRGRFMSHIITFQAGAE